MAALLPQSLVCTGAYLLGEFGRLIAADVPAREQFALLHELFPAASQATKGLLLTAFVKIYLLDAQDAQFKAEVRRAREPWSGQRGYPRRPDWRPYLPSSPLPPAATARQVLSVFERLQKYMDAELQQRASEYLVSRLPFEFCASRSRASTL